MKKRFYSSAMIGVMAIGISGCAVIDNNQANKYRAINIKEVVDNEFSITQYIESSGYKGVSIDDSRGIKIGDGYVRYIVAVHKDGWDGFLIMIFDKNLTLAAVIKYELWDYIKNKSEIRDSIRVDNGLLIHYDNRASGFESYGVLKGKKEKLAWTPIKKIMLSIDGGKYKSVKPNELVDYPDGNKMSDRHVYEDTLNKIELSVNSETGVINMSEVFEIGGDCDEGTDSEVLICLKFKYRFKSEGNTLFVDKDRIKRKQIGFVSDAVNSKLFDIPIMLADYRGDQIAVRPLSVDGEINFVYAKNNDFIDSFSKNTGIDVNGIAITYNNLIIGFDKSESSYGITTKIDDCNYLMIINDRKYKNTDVDYKISSINACKIKQK